MLHEQTPVNLAKLVREVGVVKREQLVRFFSDAEPDHIINYYIRIMTGNRLFKYDEATDIVRWHNTPKVILEEENNRIAAFWIPVSFRSKNVKEIMVLPYPFQFLFITHEDEVYDIAACNTSAVAMVCRRRLDIGKLPDIEDEVNHIMLTRSEEAGRKLAGYGFDSFCVLDKNHEPNYFEWE